MTISKSLKFATLHNMAIFTRDNAGKGYTIAALVEDYNDTAMMMGFDFLMIGKPGRVAKLVELMDHVLRRLEAMPEYAQPAPEITAEQRADHEQTAETLTGILKSHGIDPQDWDGVMDYLFSTQGHPLKYMVKIYVDYIYCHDCAVTREEAELLANGDYLPEELFGGKVKVCPRHFGASDLGYTLANPEHAYNEQLEALREAVSHSDSWHRITDQESRAAYTNACNFAHSKSNRLPRGNCAVRMLGLGWEFNY